MTEREIGLFGYAKKEFKRKRATVNDDSDSDGGHKVVDDDDEDDDLEVTVLKKNGRGRPR